jgi:hypothetical protein
VSGATHVPLAARAAGAAAAKGAMEAAQMSGPAGGKAATGRGTQVIHRGMVMMDGKS